MNKMLITSTVIAAFSVNAWAAAPADWSKIKPVGITVFLPGVSPLEWIMAGTRHSGARGIKKGEDCTGCHSEELAEIGQKMGVKSDNEPAPIAGKASSIPVQIQAVHDDETLYLRFSWEQPPASGAPKMDAENPVKIAFMLEDGNKVELANEGGCWATCHSDLRTMPGVTGEKTKHIKNPSLADGRFYDLLQWRSGDQKGHDGYVADQRIMEGGKALTSAEGKLEGSTWSVVFARKFTGGEGDITLEPGKAYNFGFAIHDDNAAGRFHHVSLGYKLGINTKGDITASKLQ